MFPLLNSTIFAFMLVFCRVGSSIMLMPGVGEAYVSARIRLMFALAVTALLSPIIQPRLPHLPDAPAMLVVLIVGEIVIGVMLGALARIMVSAAHTAGALIATQIGLASALVLDITQGAQSTAVSNIMSVTVVTLLFAMNLHHLLLAGFVQSYEAFAPGTWPAMGGALQTIIHAASTALSSGLQMAAPFVVVGLILNLGAGVLARLMPQLQIFFLLMSPQILLGVLLLSVSISGMMLWYMGTLQEAFSNLNLLEG